MPNNLYHECLKKRAQSTDPQKPLWDDGLSTGAQVNPCYLDVFDQVVFIPQPTFGQKIQRGKAAPRLAQPECLTSIMWSASGSADLSAPWNGNIQKVNQSGVCPEIRIQATDDTDTGVIIPKALYSGLYKQTPTSQGEAFAFYDHSDICPPPGYYQAFNESNEPLDCMNFYRFTGHKPKTCDQNSPSLQYEPGQSSYNIYRNYTLEVKDVSGRPMRGAWVQERWTALAAGALWQANYGFGVNEMATFWLTVQSGTDRGKFGYDTIGYFGALPSLYTNGGILYTGTHEYWVGTNWAPTLNYTSPNIFWFTESNKPTTGYGLGVKTDTYDVTIRTNNASQSKQGG